MLLIWILHGGQCIMWPLGELWVRKAGQCLGVGHTAIQWGWFRDISKTALTEHWPVNHCLNCTKHHVMHRAASHFISVAINNKKKGTANKRTDDVMIVDVWTLHELSDFFFLYDFRSFIFLGVCLKAEKILTEPLKSVRSLE